MSENNIKLYIIKERGSAPPRQVTKVIKKHYEKLKYANKRY